MVMVIKTFIKKNKFVSETMWTLFPHLYNIFKKNKQTFGNLFDTLNYYLLFGIDKIAETKEYLNVLISMANESLVTNSEGGSITVYNSEGAILFQIMF